MQHIHQPEPLQKLLLARDRVDMEEDLVGLHVLVRARAVNGIRRHNHAVHRAEGKARAARVKIRRAGDLQNQFDMRAHNIVKRFVILLGPAGKVVNPEAEARKK